VPSPEILAAAILLLAMIMYTDFGGADFGSGVWTALASGPRAREQREELFQAIGPIWETHHIWLIFALVTLFTCFPRGFAALFIALLAPLVLMLVGINFRGAAFAFRHFGRPTDKRLPLTAQVFSISSIITPLTMGMAVTAVAAGRIKIVNGNVEAGFWTSWITPLTIVGGLIALAICAYLTPIYMTVRSSGELQEDFRKRGLLAAIALGILSTVELPVAWWDAPRFAERLFSPIPLIAVGLAVIGGLVTLYAVWSRHYLAAQVMAPATAAFILIGFGLALYPYLILDQLSFADAAAPGASIGAYLTILPFGALVLVPSLILLYKTFIGPLNPDASS
jgi:cytochrome d ubiquinol oxidase subunit II